MEIRQIKSRYLGKLTVIYDGTYYLHSDYYGILGKAERAERVGDSSHFVVKVSDRDTNYAPAAAKAFARIISKMEGEYSTKATFTVHCISGYFVGAIKITEY